MPATHGNGDSLAGHAAGTQTCSRGFGMQFKQRIRIRLHCYRSQSHNIEVAAHATAYAFRYGQLDLPVFKPSKLYIWPLCPIAPVYQKVQKLLEGNNIFSEATSTHCALTDCDTQGLVTSKAKCTSRLASDLQRETECQATCCYVIETKQQQENQEFTCFAAVSSRQDLRAAASKAY